jgi:hypothetical protein
MNVTLLKALIALAPMIMLFAGTFVLQTEDRGALTLMKPKPQKRHKPLQNAPLKFSKN